MGEERVSVRAEILIRARADLAEIPEEDGRGLRDKLVLPPVLSDLPDRETGAELLHDEVKGIAFLGEAAEGIELEEGHGILYLFLVEALPQIREGQAVNHCRPLARYEGAPDELYPSEFPVIPLVAEHPVHAVKVRIAVGPRPQARQRL